MKKALLFWLAITLAWILYLIFYHIPLLKDNAEFVSINGFLLFLFYYLNKSYKWLDKVLFQRLFALWLVLICLFIVGSSINDQRQAGVDFWSIFQTGADEPKEDQKEAKKKKLIKQKATDLKERWQATLKNYPDTNVDIALYSKADDHTYKLTHQPQDNPFYTASIIKVSILAQILHLEQTKQLTVSDEERTLMQSMIEQSDNEATTYLLTNKLDGYNGTAPLFKALKMRHSAPDLTAWGTSTTTATDQITLLNEIFFSNNFLNKENTAYIENLMGNIESDQNWGISAISDESQLKNGWLQYNEAGWIVNSIGHVIIAGKEYTMAVLTNNNTTQAEGQQLIEQLSKDVQKVVK
ncbi:serine hydrolase [Enterococcus hermanniensis]|uniref:serine hydrolase n=1 Tax=Enterococcus hermanniensis TaxID=249189 RepID=UPI001471C890|nr:serine hydrolase [Enterococcus hermanniensis]